METLLAFAIGLIYAASLYLMLRRSVVKLILGLSLFGHASNLLIFTSGTLLKGRPPLIDKGAHALHGVPTVDYADPLPAALILTAIVIGFAILAFAAVLVKRAIQEVGVDDTDRMNATDLEGAD
ncbi:MAG: Na+/H+ antiporter subunit C [Phycisphaerales bacterium]